MGAPSKTDIMGKLIEEEDDKRKSVLFASKQIIIRKNLYYIMAKSIKVSSDSNLCI
jgi:hypothetical protein